MSVHVVVSLTIAAPAAEVFDTVHDYHVRLQWDTLLRGAYTVDDRSPGKGVVAICSAKWHLGGFVFATRYVTFRRPTLAAVTLTKPYFIFENWSASIRHSDVAEQRSEVVYTLSMRCRPALLARPLEAVAGALFRIETQRRLRALKRYLEATQSGTVGEPKRAKLRG